jgi:hypothetical protein
VLGLIFPSGSFSSCSTTKMHATYPSACPLPGAHVHMTDTAANLSWQRQNLHACIPLLVACIKLGNPIAEGHQEVVMSCAWSTLHSRTTSSKHA